MSFRYSRWSTEKKYFEVQEKKFRNFTLGHCFNNKKEVFRQGLWDYLSNWHWFVKVNKKAKKTIGKKQTFLNGLQLNLIERIKKETYPTNIY